MPVAIPQDNAVEHVTMRKVGLRLVPFLMLCYFIAYVDRVNAGFAALSMNKDIGLSQAVFGIGGGLFYIAYILFEVPSNLAMEKVGARLLDCPHHDQLGAGRRGHGLRRRAVLILPGALHARRGRGRVLPRRHPVPDLLVSEGYRARIVATFMVAIPLSSFIGSPLSAALLQMDGIFGLHGWQWLFIVEAVPRSCSGLGAGRCCPTGRPTPPGWRRRSATG